MDKYKKIMECLDIPSGSILGLFTLLIIAGCVHAYFTGHEIPASVVSLYQFVVGAFAGSKAVVTVWGKKDETQKQ